MGFIASALLQQAQGKERIDCSSGHAPAVFSSLIVLWLDNRSDLLVFTKEKFRILLGQIQ
jgi:hypothetical protein